MQIQDLVGKVVLRTNPVKTINCRSFMDTPVKVIYADEFNAVVEWVNEPLLTGKQCVLASDYLDDSWRECPKEILQALER